MNGTKFFRILVVCVALLVGTVVFTSIALAKGKPPPIAYKGYVEFPTPDPGSVNMWNDGEPIYAGVRKDPDNSFSILLTLQGSALVEAEFVCGWPPGTSNYSRRVGMNIGPNGAELTTVALSDPELTFRNIFLSQDFSGPSYIGHLRGKVKKSGSSYVPVYSDAIADTITRSDLIGEGLDGDDLKRYYFSSYTGLSEGDQHLVYGLSYQSCTVTGPDLDGEWTITFGGDPVELFVYKLPTKGKKPPPSNPKPEDYTEHVILGTYDAGLPFTYKTWYDPDQPNEPEPDNAPGKYDALSTLWGDIKSQ